MPRGKKPPKNAVRVNGKAIHLTRIANKYGIDKSYLSKILNGKSPVEKMSIEKAELFAKVFGCTIEDLVAYLRTKAATPVLTETPYSPSDPPL